MKIKFTDIDEEMFRMDEHVLNGELVYLIQPKLMGCKWTQENKIFRSSLWNHEGELISAGFPKFTNFGENPENFPVPTSLKNTTIVEKMDGSLLCVSKYKGNVILRTRGTVDASKLENGHELELFKEEYGPKILNDVSQTWEHSYLFEWTSPLQRIVISYGDIPKWTLIGIVKHEDYSLFTQGELDNVAFACQSTRPETYTFSTVEDLLSNVEEWKGKEGVVIYSKNGQTLHKCKAAEYLIKHRLKDALRSIEQVLEFYVQEDCPDYHTFYAKVAEVVDFETAEECRGDISRCVDAKKEVDKITEHMQFFVDVTLKNLPTRKEQALKILSSYGDTNRAGFVFSILDGKELEKKDIKKLFWQVLKK
jgi:hypothetical protein